MARSRPPSDPRRGARRARAGGRPRWQFEYNGARLWGGTQISETAPLQGVHAGTVWKVSSGSSSCGGWCVFVGVLSSLALMFCGGLAAHFPGAENCSRVLDLIRQVSNDLGRLGLL